MSSENSFDPQWWEQHYQGHTPHHGPPGGQLAAEVTGLPTGTALDAGCGTGADAVWLAARGWTVTAVDVSATAVRAAEAFAAGRPGIEWVVADLTTWQPPRRYDLVVSQYVHPDLPFTAFVARLATMVAPGGTLLVVGHDTHSAAHAAAGATIGPDAVTAALGPDEWTVTVAETRTHEVQHGGHRRTLRDLVVKARRGRPADPAAETVSAGGRGARTDR
ncbi:class I SAM-dependent methyltransferase [Catenuloplanes indicus]|uniref:2-polyprenyl-3-methyl-5-hydroxy-6-metoxy-1, 4-benzoquinol methylase n=1 Tax=Catenuloplanes indicus TaxID=137267 RepID=A0AAE3VVH0_9ACTN|nr:class I SAM-dependent methyltransferase [Catenuloplanes indicus]MDQ0363745.1 2-polyprenyl-3-methyl-5-hydroxy-6-metoxy-1,4-benzoquinol methylase [Catenuloplanes indicus]